MKIRNGWVGNSSSSSFVIVGYMVEDDDGLINKYLEEENLNDYDPDDFLDWLYKTIDGEELTVQTGLDEYGRDTIFIGVNPEEMKDHETKLQFKKRIANLINKKTGMNYHINSSKIMLYADGGYDG